jgi:hypothetical protein
MKAQEEAMVLRHATAKGLAELFMCISRNSI